LDPRTLSKTQAHAQGTYLFVLPWEPHNVGGVTNVVKNLARAMGTQGSFAPKIAVNGYHDGRPRQDRHHISFDFSILLATTPWGVVKACAKAPVRLWRTLQLLRSNNVQVVNFHYPGLGPLGIALLKRVGLYRGRLLLSFHGTDVFPARGRIERWARDLIHGTADRLIACSNSLASRMIRELGVPASRVKVIFNGVDESVFQGRGGDGADARLHTPEWFVINVGSFIPRKNHMLLIEAFAQLAPRYPDLHLCIAGADGAERPAVQAAIDRCGLASRVRIFIDLDQSDVATLLSRAAVCVQPSLAESFPLALLEAAASGTPVVASNIPGHDELIHEKVTGLLFPLGDTASCAAAIATLLDDPGSATTMAMAQSERVREKFTLLSCLREYEKLATLD
jgi:glycosyltransferase involved in cell wall biosynthesis